MKPIVKNQQDATPAAVSIGFTLNGREVTVEAEAGRSLLDILRNEFGMTSPKDGCSPQASCGCCTVLIDGKPRISCALPFEKIAGRTVVTLEGVPPEDRKWIAECFARTGGLQCGFCIPGIAVSALALLEKNPNPSRNEIIFAIRSHLCRCTGYVKIVDAIELMAKVKRGEALPPADESGKIGTRMDRYRAQEFTLGDFKYVDDMKIEGMLYAAMRFSDHPRATVKRIDSAPAMAMAGVERVITAADIPGERYVGLIEKDWPVLIPEGETTRCLGDVIAVAVAENPRLARWAAATIEIDYDELDPVCSAEEGLEPGAPQVHPDRANLLSHSAIRRGDAEAAFTASAHVAEGTYQTQRIEHMFMEPEACLAIPQNNDKNEPALKIFSQSQGVFDDRKQVASILGWDIERVEVELVSNGGAFGGKEDLSIQGQTALAAALTGRPVKTTLKREDSIRLHPKRHAIKMHVKAACDAEGRLTAVHARMLGDKGAYASVGAKVLERAAGHAIGPYRVADIDIEAKAVYTNNAPCGAMRGFGANQAAFAIENLLNKLAKKVGIDAWEIRSRNILEQGDRFCTGQVLDKPFGLRRTLDAVRDQFRSAKYAGIACGIKNVGIGNGMADLGKCTITVESPKRLTIRQGFTEMGQGLFTICIQAACQETGLPPELFRATTDTTHDLDCAQTTASRGTVLSGNAVIAAAKKLRADLDAGKTLDQLAGTIYRGDYACTYTSALGADVKNPRTHITYGFATQVAIAGEDGRIEKIIAAHDVGRALNPKALEGQIEGAVHMGLGYALTEELPMEGGRFKSLKVRDLGVIRAHQMPEIEVIVIEEPDPECPYGARGVGEIGLVPTAPAVAGALEAFDGVHRTVLPMKDSEAARAILDPKWKPKEK